MDVVNIHERQRQFMEARYAGIPQAQKPYRYEEFPKVVRSTRKFVPGTRPKLGVELGIAQNAAQELEILAADDLAALDDEVERDAEEARQELASQQVALATEQSKNSELEAIIAELRAQLAVQS